MWRLVGRPRTLAVTKELAEQYMNMEPAPRDRPLSERRLLVYERMFKEGMFRPCTWAAAICKETGGIYRVNGKHTSTLLSTIKNIPEFFVVLEDYECDTLEDVAQLYSTFDSKMQSRTASDIYNSFAAVVPELKDIPHTQINQIVQGMSYHRWFDDNWSRTAAERAELLIEYPEFGVWYRSMFSSNKSGEHGHLKRQAIIGAMFGTWLKDQARATQFWTAVRDETGESPELPDRKLGRYLMSAVTLRNFAKSNTRKKAASNREMFVKCVHAWNAWRMKKDTNMKYFAEKEIPEIK